MKFIKLILLLLLLSNLSDAADLAPQENLMTPLKVQQISEKMGTELNLQGNVLSFVIEKSQLFEYGMLKPIGCA